ncbi:hypothetical protein QCA50_006978 [Cerrena zonata]|uniref:Mur ligase central domain-containing protein n=1 Tax=Cerrena zonata TaxID=2478898 RepID=A0AAW0GAC4_9APHY
MSINLSLDRIRKIQEYLPKYSRPTCHIAGTNGKGSVSALLTSIFQAADPPLSVGRFNSPHLVSICDCITIDNQPVSLDIYTKARTKVVEADTTHGLQSSNFEILTMTALAILEEAQVDVAVIEVGLGGRLDATNGIFDDRILASALTSVDLDHQSFLGNTVAAIAREKAAIARKGKPFILGAQRHPEVYDVVKEVVPSNGGELVQASVAHSRDRNSKERDASPLTLTTLRPEMFPGPPGQPVEIQIPVFSEPLSLVLPLQGQHQLENLGTALSMFSAIMTHPSCAEFSKHFRQRFTSENVQSGVARVKWPGRLSFHKIPVPLNTISDENKGDLLVLADGAHNPASSETLGAYSRPIVDPGSDKQRRTCSRTSHHINTLSPLLPPKIRQQYPNIQIDVNVGLLRFTSPDGMPWVKSVPPSELREVVASLDPDATTWIPTTEDDPNGQLAEGIEWAYKRQRGQDGVLGEGLVVVAGSLYLVADLYRLLGTAGW